MENKITLRNKFKEIRKTLDMQSRSFALCELLRLHKIYLKSKNVLIFYPLNDEVDLRILLTDDKNFYLPRVCGKNLDICPYSKGDELVISKFNICEPCTNPISPSNLDLIVVPALACDKDNFRLGYGGGFYDRLLKNHPSIPTVTLIPEELLCEKLPIEEYDEKVDFVISC